MVEVDLASLSDSFSSRKLSSKIEARRFEPSQDELDGFSSRRLSSKIEASWRYIYENGFK